MEVPTTNCSGPSFPFRITWDITHSCNLRCKHCFVIYQEKTLRDDSEALRMRIARQIVEASPFIISVAGGEPTILPDINDLLSVLESCGAKIVLATNGICENKDIVDGLKKVKNFSLQVSLDSFDKTRNDLIRGRGAFDKAVSFIKSVSADIPVTLAVTLTKVNAGDIGGLIKLCHDLNVSAIKIQPFIETMSTPQPSLKPTEGQILAASMQLEESASRELVVFHPFAKKKTLGVFMGNSCRSVLGITECTVLPNGDITGCGANIDNSVIFGNLLEANLLDIWNDVLKPSGGCSSLLSGCTCV